MNVRDYMHEITSQNLNTIASDENQGEEKKKSKAEVLNEQHNKNMAADPVAYDTNRKCYDCEGYSDGSCGFDLDTRYGRGISCLSSYSTHCYKQVMNYADGSVTVARRCAEQTEEGPAIYRDGCFNVTLVDLDVLGGLICYCSEDNCNSAPPTTLYWLPISVALLLLLTVSAL